MKILCFCNEVPPRRGGGIGLFSYRLMLMLRQGGHEVRLLQVGEERARFPEGVDIPQTCIRPVGWRWIGSALTRLKIWVVMHAMWCRGDFDVVEVPDFEGFLPLPSLFPVVVRLHTTASVLNSAMCRRTSMSLYMYERLTIFFAREVVAVSRHIADETRRVFKFRTLSAKVILNPAFVETPAERLPSATILFVGTMSEAKGVLTLADALSRVFVRIPAASVVFIGRSTNLQGRPVEHTILEILGDFRHRCRFFPAMEHEEVAKAMSTSGCLVLPSRFESFGLVVAEAMAIGLPVVFTNRPPGPELITSGVDGLLVDVFDPSEIADAICKILMNAELAQQLGARAMRRAKDVFAPEVCVSTTVRVYQELIGDLR